MAKQVSLTKGVIRAIGEAVDKLFDRAIARFLAKPPVDKRIVISVTPRVTLPSLFEAASREERSKADQTVLNKLLGIAEGFIEAQRSATKARVVKAVDDWLQEAYAKGVKTDVETVLGGELAQVWGQAQAGMHKIVAAESNNARNTGVLDGIVKVNAASGIEDPVVYFVVVRDDSLCSECKRLHLRSDGRPRLWLLSEVKRGYHRKTDDVPSIGGLHPHCRCSLVTLMPGYTFDSAGSITYKSPEHDEFKEQRG